MQMQRALEQEQILTRLEQQEEEARPPPRTLTISEERNFEVAQVNNEVKWKLILKASFFPLLTRLFQYSFRMQVRREGSFMELRPFRHAMSSKCMETLEAQLAVLEKRVHCSVIPASFLRPQGTSSEGVTIPPGGKHEISISFTPSTVGIFRSNLALTFETFVMVLLASFPALWLESNCYIQSHPIEVECGNEEELKMLSPVEEYHEKVPVWDGKQRSTLPVATPRLRTQQVNVLMIFRHGFSSRLHFSIESTWTNPLPEYPIPLEVQVSRAVWYDHKQQY